MAERIRLVQGDTFPQVTVSLYDENTGSPTDLRGATVRLKFRESGSAVIKETLTGTLLVGYEDAGGNVSVVAPYDQPGGGGRCVFAWTPASLDTTGSFEGEVEVTFDNTKIQTVYDILKFQVRGQF